MKESLRRKEIVTNFTIQEYFPGYNGSKKQDKAKKRCRNYDYFKSLSAVLLSNFLSPKLIEKDANGCKWKDAFSQ